MMRHRKAPIRKTLSILFLSTFILSGCNSDNNITESTPATSAFSNVKYDSENHTPAIISLEKTGVLAVGNTLQAQSTCTGCDSAETVYFWTIDRNNNGVFGDSITIDGQKASDSVTQASSYTLSDEDYGTRIKLEAYALSSDGTQKSQTEYVVYRPIVVKTVYNSLSAFAALKNDGSVVTWGEPSEGGDSSGVDLSGGVKTIFSTDGAFAALKEDGSVVTWGHTRFGGDSSVVAWGDTIFNENSGGDLSSGVKTIFSNGRAFAALKDDSSVVTWGAAQHCGYSSEVDLSGSVKTIFSKYWACAALRDDGSVVTWGTPAHGGDGSGVDLSGSVKTIYSNYWAFAALKNDGSVVTWGEPSEGGDSSDVDLSGGVRMIYSTFGAFAALKDDGSVVTWGDSIHGGDSSGVDFSGGVKTIYRTHGAFAALKNDGSVVTWGEPNEGGDSSGVDLSGGVKTIFSSQGAFAALKDDGSVVAWGHTNYGGDSSGVNLSSGVKTIFSTGGAFAALKDDGSVVTWGYTREGGEFSVTRGDPIFNENSGVDLSGGVMKIFSSFTAFTALKNDGSLMTWGYTHAGEDSSNVTEELVPQEILEESSL